LQIDGIGEVLAWSEFWLLIYAECGHETYFSRTGHGLFEPDEVEREVRAYYAQCQACAHPWPSSELTTQGPDDRG
jgi:hypothetical protein